MIKLNIIVFFLLCAIAGLAQQRPVQSLYMFDPLLVNPAYAGTQVQLSATAIYRNQWVNLPGAPKTMTATVHSGFLKSRMGLGILVANDQIGIHNDLSFYGIYSYKIKLSSLGILSFGLQGGFNNIRSDYTKLNLKNLNDPNLSGALTKLNPNIGAGAFYHQKQFYLGFSVPQIINNSVFDLEGNGSLSKQLRYYYVQTGFSKDLSHNVKVIPSALIRLQEEAPISFDVNATVVFQESVGLGVSYRLNEGMVGLFELQINDNFHVGYAYDFTTSELNQFSNGSHEIMLNYRVKIMRLHQGLPCPSYW
ncbi:MAG TPA: type IX secretion system membrane protein PorP/SprF [Cyclobacteriaceae bacterium]